MLDIFDHFATDESAETNGTWVPLGGAKFLIARSGNSKYVKLLSQEVEKNQKLLEVKNDEADKLSDKIMITVMSETILLGWEDTAYQGKPLPYSKENAIKLLSHKDFRRWVAAQADDIGNFKAKLEDDQVKN